MDEMAAQKTGRAGEQNRLAGEAFVEFAQVLDYLPGVPGQMRVHAHQTFQGAWLFRQSWLSSSNSRKVSIGCQKPSCGKHMSCRAAASLRNGSCSRIDPAS